MEIGVINSLANEGKCFAHIADFGLNVCQLGCWNSAMATDEIAANIRTESAKYGVRICAVWAGWPGPAEWNFTKGPTTLGIVPEDYRAERLIALKQWADFAKKIGAPAIITHCGFIPENMTDPTYPAVVEAITEIASYCNDLGLGFWFETGQETPVVILRIIQKIGLPNMGINLDPANLLMYGKGNPIDSLDVFGQYVRNIHVKDGMCPTDGEKLGKEVPAGEGLVRFPEFISKLKRIGYTGELIIEREISGDEQARDIRKTVGDLNTWLNG